MDHHEGTEHEADHGNKSNQNPSGINAWSKYARHAKAPDTDAMAKVVPRSILRAVDERRDDSNTRNCEFAAEGCCKGLIPSKIPNANCYREDDTALDIPSRVSTGPGNHAGQGGELARSRQDRANIASTDA